MICIARVDIQNTEEDCKRFIVARYCDGQLWYWGSWDLREDAERVVEVMENGIVVVRG